MGNMQNIMKENQITLMVISSKNFSDDMKKIAKELSGIKKMTCYVSLNKPYNTIADGFDKSGIPGDNFCFVDALTKKAGMVDSENKVVFISSPRALTELSIGITKATSIWNSDAVLFDSLSTLLVYENMSNVLKFVHSIINSMRVKGKSCVFTVVSDDLKSELAKDLGMFVDKIEEIK